MSLENKKTVKTLCSEKIAHLLPVVAETEYSHGGATKSLVIRAVSYFYFFHIMKVCIPCTKPLTKDIDMVIRTFGVGGRVSECERMLSSELSGENGRLILLPIPTTRDNKYITGTAFTVDDIGALIDGESLIVGYGIPQKLLSLARERGSGVFDASLDEEFLLENAELTARGAIGHILTHTDRDIGDMRIGVVGYGRIGARLIRWLLPFGASVTLYTCRHSVAVAMGEMGVSARLVGADTDYSDIDLLINTAPARQIDEAKIGANTKIIDLASGRIFEDSPRLTKLASIPDGFYPVSAGRLYARSILRFLSGEKK